MKLKDLEKYNSIIIQCHDNPDADTIGSGFALYKYFKSKNKDVRLVYSGRHEIQKSNLVLLVGEFSIPIEYVDVNDPPIMGENDLWITVDCQYGAGNVTKFSATNIAIIDHHQVEIDNVEMSLIRPDLGSCSTLIWLLLKEAGYEIDNEDGLGTILYYGLFTDTNQFSEIYNPVDRDMMDMIPHDNRMVSQLKNSNISLRELEVAGVAMLRYSYNEEYNFAVIKSQPCDPNILGLISDFLLQVDTIKTCVVFNEVQDGYKLSIRSCVREVNASELANYLTKGIGSGGGHYEKAGGFISERLFREKYSLNAEGYFNTKMTEYFDTYEIITAKNYEANISEMSLYKKKAMPIGCVKAKDVLPLGTPITVRSLEGDSDLIIEDDLYIMIGIKGEVYPSREEKLKRTNNILDKKYVYSECVIDNTYIPTIKNRITGQNLLITDYAKVCIPTGEVKIYAKQLTRGIKVFTAWDKEKYMLGQPGDYLAVRTDDMHDIYIIEQKIFGLTYEAVES